MTSTASNGATRYDVHGHPLAWWDEHPSCRSCLYSVGIFCSRGNPCSMCKSWSDSMWSAFEVTEVRSGHKNLKRQRLRAAGKATSATLTDDSLSSSPDEEPTEVELLLPPTNPLRWIIKATSTPKHNTSIGADADWSPLESHSSGGSSASKHQASTSSTARYKSAGTGTAWSGTAGSDATRYSNAGSSTPGPSIAGHTEVPWVMTRLSPPAHGRQTWDRIQGLWPLPLPYDRSFTETAPP